MSVKSKILIIDESVSMLRLLFNVLSDHYEVIVMRDPVSAYNWLHEGNYPALTIVELSAAEMIGFSFIRNIRISGLHRTMPVVVLSSFLQHDHVQEAIIHKADACFKKPFSPAALSDAVKHLIDTRYAYAAA